jgi:hypothetical protein
MGCGSEEFLEIKTRSFLPSVKDAQSHSFAKLSALSLNLIFLAAIKPLIQNL